MVIIAIQFRQRSVQCFIDMAQSIIRIHDLIHHHVDFHVQTVVKLQEVSLNGFSNIIRVRGVAVRGFFWLRYFFQGNGIWSMRECSVKLGKYHRTLRNVESKKNRALKRGSRSTKYNRKGVT